MNPSQSHAPATTLTEMPVDPKYYSTKQSSIIITTTTTTSFENQPYQYKYTSLTTTSGLPNSTTHTYQPQTNRLGHSQTFSNFGGATNNNSNNSNKQQQSATAITTSKSNNCLTEELTENEELIDRLFPKCRPKSKQQPSPTASAHSKTSRTSERKTRRARKTMRSSQSSMENAVGQSTSNRNTRGRSMSTAEQHATTRRLWRFMDISPPSSSPPLMDSPEDSPPPPPLPVTTTYTTNNTSAHYRLDSLLSASETSGSSSQFASSDVVRNPGRLVSTTNGIKKANRFQLDPIAFDPNDGDDYILFSRCESKPNDHFLPPKPEYRDSDEINGEMSTMSSPPAMKPIEGRNRIEMAGGKEIISSSRSIRAKRRTTSGGQATKASPAPHFPPLYSVSMATMSSSGIDATSNYRKASRCDKIEPVANVVEEEEEEVVEEVAAVVDKNNNADVKSETQTPPDSGIPSSAATTASNKSAIATTDKTFKAGSSSTIESSEYENAKVTTGSVASRPVAYTGSSQPRTTAAKYEDVVDEEDEQDEQGEETRPDSANTTATTCKSSVASIDIDFTESLIREIDQVLERPNLSDILKFEQVTGVKFNNDELASGRYEVDKHPEAVPPPPPPPTTSNKISLSSSSEMSNLLQTKLEAISKAEQASATNDDNDRQTEVQSTSAQVKESTNADEQCVEDVGGAHAHRVIGTVPIAQYEGSPKRYGPKPGYPRRVVATNNSTSCSTAEEFEEDEMMLHHHHHHHHRAIESNNDKKSQPFSPENGSPHSTTSSGTFTSTEIHSSSSQTSSSSSNAAAKLNGFGNWNLKSRIVDNFEDQQQQQQQNPPPQQPTTSSTDEQQLVKSILSLPAGMESDPEDVAVQEVKTLGCTRPKLSNEPIYSTLNFDKSSSPAGGSGRYPGSGRLVHAEHEGPALQPEAPPPPTTVVNTYPVDRPISTSSSSSTRRMSNGCLPERPQPIGCPNQKVQSWRPMSGGTTTTSSSRNVPKSLALGKQQQPAQYPTTSHNNTTRSFDSIESTTTTSHRSSMDRHPTRGGTGRSYQPADYSYSPSDDDYGGGHYDEGRQPQYRAQVSYSSTEPPPVDAANNNKEAAPTSTPKLAQAKAPCMFNYESSPGYHSSDISAESCTDELCKSNDTSVNPEGRRPSTMPVLEDGLSSGRPSSDEMDYEEEDELDDDEDDDEEEDEEDEEEGDDGKGHDLDDYVKEYTTNQQEKASDSGQYYHQQDQLKGGADYAQVHKQPGAGETQYRCQQTTSNDHHHQHNHPIAQQFDSTKHLASPVGDAYAGGDKYCYSSKLRGSSQKSPASGHGHHHYHHYYHHHHGDAGQTTAAGAAATNLPATNTTTGGGGYRPSYPNLATSPTSPNSPSAGGGSSGHYHSGTMSSPSINSNTVASGLKAPSEAGTESVNAGGGGGGGVGVVAHGSPSVVGDGVSNALNGTNVRHHHDEDCDTDQETDRLLGAQRTGEDHQRTYYEEKSSGKRNSNPREAHDPKVLIEGVLFRARYLGSTQLVCDGQPTKATRMMQAEEAVSRIKSLAPEGETQPSTEVDLFISTEKIMVLNTDLKEIMMDHALRTISYIADIGDLLVLMARRRTPLEDPNDQSVGGGGNTGSGTSAATGAASGSLKRLPKMICHVFESEEAQYIAQSIGQAFQVAYMEFLKANGIEDSSFLKEMDYQEVLNSQEIFGNELEMFAKREKQKEVIVPKQKNEILGIVIVESGWGSMLPTVVIANMAQNSPSARCGQLNIGDQIIAINGISLVGLPLSTCQAYVKNTKNQTAVKFTIVPCAPVVEVKIKRPDTKYQLGFSVQNGVICSLLRGGIAERGGVRVGHRIIEINGQSVVAVPHDRIVNLLATSVGEIHMKTMPTSMFRLLTGQESPSYM